MQGQIRPGRSQVRIAALVAALFAALWNPIAMTGLVAPLTAQATSPSHAAQETNVPLLARVRDDIRARLESPAVPGALTAKGDPLFATASLGRFYEDRGFEPVWIGPDGTRSTADTLLAALLDVEADGLRPEDYHVEAISEVLEAVRLRAASGRAPDPDTYAALELLLTDAFLLVSSHLVSGRTDPETLDPKWVAVRQDFDPPATLNRALERGIEATLSALRPQDPGYSALRTMYERYRSQQENGGWERIPEEEPHLELGVRDQRVPALRRRLEATGELPPSAAAGLADPLLFDAALDSAVRAFQGRHGLSVDGVVGPGTLAALNVSVARRAEQIKVNLERWRWLPAKLGERYLIVNAASFVLNLIERGDTLFSARVVVGKPYRRTPVFSDRITYVVLSPYWHVPHSLAVQDHLPIQRRDPGYFSRIGMRVLRGWGDDAAEIDPASVDWRATTAASFAYRLRQDPGPLNFLGKVKIMFPNRFNVYLHDTPAKELFGRTRRDFSSGCIRVERALELTQLLLRDVPGWDMERMLSVADRRREETVRLATPVPVHLLYWTAWADSEGRVQFREDIYDRDRPLAAALEATAPGLSANRWGERSASSPSSPWSIRSASSPRR